MRESCDITRLPETTRDIQNGRSIRHFHGAGIDVVVHDAAVASVEELRLYSPVPDESGTDFRVDEPCCELADRLICRNVELQGEHLCDERPVDENVQDEACLRQDLKANPGSEDPWAIQAL